MSGNASGSAWRTARGHDWVVTSLGPEKLEAEEINPPKLGERNRRKVRR